MSTTLEAKAVVGRRITLTYRYDAELPDPPVWSGIITGVSDDKTSLWIRPDGKRYNLAARTDYEGLTYLDEVVPVPALPMGPFVPTAADMVGVWEGVPLSMLGEDGEDLILLTDDRDKAYAAALAYAREVLIDVEYVDKEDMRSCWAVFTWEPEDAESPWTVDWSAAEGDEKAVHIYYLPA